MRLLTFLPVLLAGLALPLASGHAALPVEQRILRITAPSAENETYRAQAALLLPAWSGLLERDFVIECHFEAKAFAVTLIGKDGGEKLRRSTPLTPAELFAIVDAMPMRRAEMKSRVPASR